MWLRNLHKMDFHYQISREKLEPELGFKTQTSGSLAWHSTTWTILVLMFRFKCKFPKAQIISLFLLTKMNLSVNMRNILSLHKCKSHYNTKKTYRYWVLSEHGLIARTTMNTCWNCERIFFGVNGWAPGSWKTIVTMSFPMWRLRSNCCRLFGVNGRSVETWNIISQSWYCAYTE